MPLREEITYILVHDRMPYHRKIRGLSDAAFRLLIEAWCWCGENIETDGRIDADVWATMRTQKARDELVRKRLVDLGEEYVEVHDWLDIQRSAVEVEKARARKVEAGSLGNHRRWHVARRLRDPNCSYCLKGAVA